MSWTPDNESPLLWLDASDASTLTFLSERVSVWADKSGNEFLAQQPTFANRPVFIETGLNGYPALHFTSDRSCFMRMDAVPTDINTASLMLAVVVTTQTDFNQQEIFGYTTESAGLPARRLGMRITSAETVMYVHGTSTSFPSVHIPSSLNTPMLVGGYRPVAQESPLYIGRDGQTDYTPANVTLTAVSAPSWGAVGAFASGSTTQTSFFRGYISEILIFLDYDLELRQNAEGYLANKWGMGHYLPLEHPFYTEPPPLFALDAPTNLQSVAVGGNRALVSWNWSPEE